MRVLSIWRADMRQEINVPQATWVEVFFEHLARSVSLLLEAMARQLRIGAKLHFVGRIHVRQSR
jgi:hypothetical protein